MVVLPLVPVMPTTVMASLGRPASSCAASATKRCGAALRTTGTLASMPSRATSVATGTATAVAPRAHASRTNSTPLVRAPGRATNSVPGPTRRESTLTARISVDASPRASTPSRASAISSVPSVPGAVAPARPRPAPCGSSTWLASIMPPAPG